MTATTTWTVREVPVPASLEAPDAWLLLGATRVRTAGVVDVWGSTDLADSPQAEQAATTRGTRP